METAEDGKNGPVSTWELGQITTEKGQSSYSVSFEKAADFLGEQEGSQESISATITFSVHNQDVPTVSFTGAKKLEGEYYPVELCTGDLDWHTRYIGPAELRHYPTEELRLLRNQIFAAHGRKFKTDDLNQYFSGKLWYKGRVEPEDFSEDVLSEIEKRNLALIQKLEKEVYDVRSVVDGHSCALEDLPAAPYLFLLEPHRQRGIHVDMTAAKDMGAYYEAPGSIFAPVCVTAKQLDEVQAGGQARVVLNELTGEEWILTKDMRPGYELSYGYLLLREGEEPGPDSREVNASYDFDTEQYELWEFSDDTLMKEIYEGTIFVLKNAVYGADISLALSSEHQQEITVEYELSGNYLYHNGKGYITAVYLLMCDKEVIEV